MSDNLEVIPAGEIKEAFTGLQTDIVELQKQMAENKDATGLELEKRSDDLAKALDAVEDFSKRIEDIDRKTQQNAFSASFGSSAGELKGALDSFQGGFKSFDGDNEAIEHSVGSKPQIKHLVEGVFSTAGDSEGQFYAPRHESILRLQKAADDVYTVDACIRAGMDTNDLQEYNRRGGARSLGVFKSFKRVAENFQKAAGDLIDTSTEVANWLPTQFSANLYEQVKIGLPLVNMFQEIPMGAATVELPLDMNDNEATRVTEVTTITGGDPWSDTTFVNPSAFTSSKITLVAEKLRSRYWLSNEASEDAVVAMLPLLNRKHRRNMGEALEDAILNGQVGGLDTGGTHFGKANPSAATDARDCWDGLRKFVSVNTSVPATDGDMGNVKPTVTAIRGLRAALGEYGTDPNSLAYIFGIYGYIKLLDDASVLTVDKLGPAATIRTGVLGQVDGCDVVVSRRMPQNANAAGIIDGVTTNRTLAVVVNTNACILGNRRRNTPAQQRHEAMDATEVVAFWRGDFQPVYPQITTPFVGTLYNIASA